MRVRSEARSLRRVTDVHARKLLHHAGRYRMRGERSARAARCCRCSERTSSAQQSRANRPRHPRAGHGARGKPWRGLALRQPARGPPAGAQEGAARKLQALPSHASDHRQRRTEAAFEHPLGRGLPARSASEHGQPYPAAIAGGASRPKRAPRASPRTNGQAS